MKKARFIIFFWFLILLTACSGKKKMPDFAEGTIVSLSFTPVNVNSDATTYTMNIEVNQSGELIIYADGFSKWYGKDEPEVIHLNITLDKVEEIKNLIEEEDLYNLHKDVGNKDNMEGIKKSLTVYTVEGEYTVYGLNPSNRSFNRVYDYIYDLELEELASYTTRINSIQTNGLKNDIGIVITDVNDEIIFTKEDIYDVYYVDRDVYEEATKTDAVYDENNFREETATPEDAEANPNCRVVIELKDEAKEILNQNFTITNRKDYVTYNVYNDNELILFMMVKKNTDDGKIYSSKDYSVEEAEKLTEILKEGLE